MKETLRAFLCILVLVFTYWLVRFPANALPTLAYYDDGETLYHTMNILEGRAPHLDDVNHHFTGYLLPFVIGAKFLGFSADLVRQVLAINQILMAFGVYLILRLSFSFGLSLAGSLLAITAREPWVLGFYPQQQINLLSVYMILLALKSLSAPSAKFLYASALLCGLAFTFDQRALFLALIPVVALLLRNRGGSINAAREVLLVALCLAALPCLGLYYLWANGALQEFVRQTWTFPRAYRIGSKSFADMIVGGIVSHKYLLGDTTFMTCAAALGALTLLRLLRSAKTPEIRDRALLLIVCIIPLSIMPFFGGRDFEYYTITWLPYLAIMTVVSTEFFKRLAEPFRRLYLCVTILPVVFSVAGSVQNREIYNDYTGDGIFEVVNFLKEELAPRDSLFVWGYRPDIHVRLERLSPYPFVNQIMIQPDSQIKGEEERRRHVFPAYEQRFFKLLDSSPPEVIVVFYRHEKTNAPSAANSKVTELLAAQYDKVYEVEKEDFMDFKCFFEVYRRRVDR